MTWGRFTAHKASQLAKAVKNSPADAGDMRDAGSIPGLGRSPGEGHGRSSILAWEIPWTEDWQATVLGVTEDSDIMIKQQYSP